MQRPLEHGFILVAGFLLAQLDGAAQKCSAALFQLRQVGVHRARLRGLERTQEFLLRIAEALGRADGAEAQLQQHILPEQQRVERVSEGREVFRHEIRDLLTHTGLQEAADDGGVGLAGVDLVELRKPAALRLFQHVRRQDMLLGQQMPVGQDRVRPGVAAGQLAQAGDRVADCRVPGERLVAAAAALDVFQTAVYGVAQACAAALDDDAVGHEVAAEQQILAVAQQVGHQLLEPVGQRLGIFRRAPALQRQQNDGVALGVDIDLQLFGLLIDLRHAQRAGGDLLEELAAGILLILPPFLLEAAQIGLLLAFLVDLPADILQRFQQGAFRHGLQQILLHADLNGLLREFKVVVAADENDFCLRQLRADEFAERQPVHKRHFDVRDQDVRAQLADLRQRQFAVRRVAAEFKAVPRPVDALAQPFPHDAFILHQKNLQHLITSPPLYHSFPAFGSSFSHLRRFPGNSVALRRLL